MTRLSSSLKDLKNFYTVVVIGSGYGGGIAASRLARALQQVGNGQEVCVLERGREFQPGEYPATPLSGLRQMQFDSARHHIGSRTGLYDFRINEEINVVLGCGLGGTSLINGNVALPADKRVFDDPSWPPELRDQGSNLVPYLERAKAMLRPASYPQEAPHLPKLSSLEQAAKGLKVKGLSTPGTDTRQTSGQTSPDELRAEEFTGDTSGQASARLFEATEAGTEQARTGQVITEQAPFYRPPLTINFVTGTNHVGVHQNACVGCGDCCSGCNYGAKNTVLMNYLPDAHRHGAQIFTEIGVRSIERYAQVAEDAEAEPAGWLIHCELLGAGKETGNKRNNGKGKESNKDQGTGSGTSVIIRAQIVIVAAGALGSTEILLRSKAQGLSLSNQIGEGFTGNGDFLGFAYNTPQPLNGIGKGAHPTDPEHPVGPTISGIIDLRGTPDLEEGMVIQDGAIPGPLAPFLPIAFATASRILREQNVLEEEGKESNTPIPPASTQTAPTQVTPPSPETNSAGAKNAGADSSSTSREWKSLLRGPYQGAVHHTQTFLVMAHDDGQGRMSLDPKTGRLRIAWPGLVQQQVFEKVVARLQEATKVIGGTYVANPAWTQKLGKHLVTVHPLGGCRMAEDAAGGGVNHKGQVFAGPLGQDVHPGLYVCDGAVIPRSLGINPLMTICALAERSCALLIEDYGWTLDYSLPAFQASLQI